MQKPNLHKYGKEQAAAKESVKQKLLGKQPGFLPVNKLITESGFSNLMMRIVNQLFDVMVDVKSPGARCCLKNILSAALLPLKRQSNVGRVFHIEEMHKRSLVSQIILSDWQRLSEKKLPSRAVRSVV